VSLGPPATTITAGPARSSRRSMSFKPLLLVDDSQKRPLILHALKPCCLRTCRVRQFGEDALDYYLFARRPPRRTRRPRPAAPDPARSEPAARQRLGCPGPDPRQSDDAPPAGGYRFRLGGAEGHSGRDAARRQQLRSQVARLLEAQRLDDAPGVGYWLELNIEPPT